MAAKPHLRSLCLAAWAVYRALQWRPHWIYASDPLSSPIALLLRLSGARIIYHEHDSPSPFVQKEESRFSRAVRWARGAG